MPHFLQQTPVRQRNGVGCNLYFPQAVRARGKTRVDNSLWQLDTVVLKKGVSTLFCVLTAVKST